MIKLNYLYKYVENSVFKFLNIGVINFIITYIVYIIIYVMTNNYKLSFVITFFVGSSFLAFMHSIYSFSSEFIYKRALVFIGYNAVYAFINYNILKILIEIIRINPIIAPVLTVSFLFPFNFIISKYILIKRN